MRPIFALSTTDDLRQTIIDLLFAIANESNNDKLSNLLDQIYLISNELTLRQNP